MKCKRLLTVCLSLLLICSLIISISPIRAKAAFATAATVYVAGTLVIGAAMIALGAQPGVDSAAWSQKLDEMQIVMNAVGGYLQNGCVEVLRLIDDAGQAVYYASAEFLESVRCAMFDTDILIPPFASFSAGESMTMLDGTVLVPSDECISFIVSYSGGNRVYEIFYLPNEGTIYCVDDDANKSLNYVSLDGNRHYYYAMGYGGNTYADQAGIVWPDHSANLLVRDVIDSYLAGTLDIAVADGLVGGVIPAVSVEDGVSSVSTEWDESTIVFIAPGGVPDDTGDNDGKKYVPLALAGSIVEILNTTQLQQWTGETPPEFDDYTVGTEFEILDTPEVDGYQGIEVDTVPDSGGSGSTPSVDVDSAPWLSALINALKTVFTDLFVPSESFLQTSVDSLFGKYPFLQYFTTLGDSLLSFFKGLGSKPPIIYIDLGAAEGSYAIGGKVAFIDLTWYSRYKPTMDAVLGGFLWLWFSWRLYLAAPGIISGVSGAVGSVHSYEKSQERSGRSKDT